MQFRPLGPSGIEASAVGLGAWAIGGWMWGGADDNESIRAIHAAIDAGINLIDTAPAYGFGHSEQVVGRAIRDRRDKVVLATKCGMVCDPTVGELKFRSTAAGPASDGHIRIHIFNGPESIRREVEDSLSRLGTDYLDLYQTHWQDPTTPIEATMETLEALRKEGKIRAIGACNASVEQLTAYNRAGTLDVDQEKYSMLDRQIEAEQLPYCRDQQVAVLASSPLSKGLLTGRMGPEREFPEGDLRRGDPRFSEENRRRVGEMLQQWQPIAEAHNLTLGQLTIAWTMRAGGATHVLCGARSPEQAQENAAAGDAQLSSDEIATMEESLGQLSLVS